MLKQKKQFFYAVVTAALFLVPLFAQAKGLVLCGGDGEPVCTIHDLFGLAARVLSLLVSLSGLYAVFWIVYSGFGLVLANGNESEITKHKSGITNAIIGFVLVLLSFVIINTVVNGIFKANINLTNPRCYINASYCQ